jgi:hypothetical protein
MNDTPLPMLPALRALLEQQAAADLPPTPPQSVPNLGWLQPSDQPLPRGPNPPQDLPWPGRRAEGPAMMALGTLLTLMFALAALLWWLAEG